eukprot:5973992-Amphidinium_carterae.1
MCLVLLTEVTQDEEEDIAIQLHDIKFALWRMILQDLNGRQLRREGVGFSSALSLYLVSLLVRFRT